MWSSLLVLGCAKEVPPHLRPISEDPPGQNEASISTLVGADPLVRRPSPRESGDWKDLEQGEVIILDNMLVAHGRGAFEGPREMFAALGNRDSGQSTMGAN